MSLNGKTALVTGSSRGIGKAIALRLARDGALVGVHYNGNRAAADETLKAIGDAGGQAFLLQGDMGSMEDVRRLARDAAAELKRRTGSDGLDILVNNAAIAIFATLDQADEAAFDRAMGINLKGPLFLIKALAERINDGGRIINISSSTTLGVFPQYLLYTAAKAGLNNLTRNLAKEFGPRGITVNVVAPGVTDTDMNAAWLTGPMRERVVRDTALGRVGQPEDIADLVAMVASDDARWITGQYISATGGLG